MSNVIKSQQKWIQIHSGWLTKSYSDKFKTEFKKKLIGKTVQLH